ncbi:MAG: hypothetical protein ABSH20_29935, partial [Tepidisphaeraceae bacterium]
HGIIAGVFAVICAFVGLKGIKYVARVATYLPLIPLIVLVVLLVKTAGGLSTYSPEKVIGEKPVAAVKGDVSRSAPKGEIVAEAPAKKPPMPLNTWGVLAILSTYIVGFFATAGAAGTDIASSSRDDKDVQLGGLIGISLATIVAGGGAILVVAGAYGAGLLPAKPNLNPVDLMNGGILSENTANIIMILLAISSFPAACFSAFIAANSFKSTLPNINPFVSVGIGTLIAVVLAVSGLVGKVIWVFVVIGASFGPVCGAMMADYLLAGRKWSGPRAGFNPAGWISWAIGFAVGAFNLVVNLLAPSMPALDKWQGLVPVPPVSAFVVGFVLYLLLAKLGMVSQTLPMPTAGASRK